MNILEAGKVVKSRDISEQFIFRINTCKFRPRSLLKTLILILYKKGVLDIANLLELLDSQSDLKSELHDGEIRYVTKD